MGLVHIMIRLVFAVLNTSLVPVTVSAIVLAFSKTPTSQINIP